MQSEKKELYLLNTIRWVSAATVAYGHALSLVFSIHPIGRATSSINNAISYLSALGHPAVMLFFVMSGYLVGGSVLDRLGKFDFKFYAVSRFSRIYIALIPALLLTVTLDGAAHLIAPNNPVYATHWTAPINHPIFFNYGLRNIAASVLSLENVIGGPMGSDGPLWSLGYEWFFYILFPCTLLAARRFVTSGKYCHFIAVLGTGLFMGAIGKRYMCTFWLIWCLGAYAKVAAGRKLWPAWFPSLGAVAAVLGVIASPIINQRIADPIIGIGFALFLTNPAQLYTGLNHSVDRALADFSYSLYIVHLPLMAMMMLGFVSAGITTTSRLEFGPRGVLIWLALITAGTALGYAFGFLFEQRTDELRRFLMSKLKGRGPVPVAAS